MTTHTYATLEVSKAAYDEIRKKLEDAGYQHAFHEDGLIDMHGIALTPEPADDGARFIAGLKAAGAGWENVEDPMRELGRKDEVSPQDKES